MRPLYHRQLPYGNTNYPYYTGIFIPLPILTERQYIERKKAGTQVSVFLFSTRANCLREAAKGGNRPSSRSISSEASVN